MPTGTITWYSTERGHGFIEPDGGGPEVFIRTGEVTASSSETSTPGAKVVYDVDQTADAPEARRIQLI